MAVLALAVVLVAAGAFVLVAYRQEWQWTGLPAPREDGNERSAKTLWDWLQLLGIPVALAALAFLLNKAQAQREDQRDDHRASQQRTAATDAEREATLRAYLVQMFDLMLDGRLLKSGPSSDVRAVARTATLTAVRRLDAPRRGLVVRFLAEAKLLEADSSRTNGPAAVNMDSADLNDADLDGAYLVRIDLTRANLRRANLRSNLLFANLSSADLTAADLRGAFLSGADLRLANLDRADLRGARLSESNPASPASRIIPADLRGANLRGADLRGVDLRGVKLGITMTVTESWRLPADLRGANLSGADLRGVNLRGVKLSAATIAGADLRNSKGAQLARTRGTPAHRP